MSSGIRAAVRALLPELRLCAERAEVNRTPSEEMVAELTATGLFSMLRPAAFGGAQAHPLGFFAAVREIAAVCPSTGWAVSFLGITPWHLARLGPRMCEEVWAAGPDVLVTASYAPGGRLEPVDDGYVLRGEWATVPGVEHCDWACLAAVMADDSGRPLGLSTVVVPCSDLTAEGYWNTTGLRGTGSRRVSVRSAFVPRHRARMGTTDPADDDRTAPMYRCPLSLIYSMAACMPVVGIAQGAYDYHLARTRSRAAHSVGGLRSIDDAFAHVAVARAITEIDASVLQLERDLGEAVDLAVDGTPIPMELRLRARRDQVRATERAVEAVDLLAKAAGGHAVQHGVMLERAARAVRTAAAHLVNNPEQALHQYGRWAYGLGIDDSMIMV
ncbi:acyl-CoA dehydrogenase family protein [Nocardia rhizosphaerihabitans]|uniref:acyl-CoA dehydrogenase family protein n=1 Tax=Nocardia rhizosphaerihabitans TaxID=1691570 RepID=UPI00366A91BE